MRSKGDEFEDLVNGLFGFDPVPNSGGTIHTGTSRGYDHAHPYFVGESKVKSNLNRPSMTKAEYDKLLKRAEREGHKYWIYFIKYKGGAAAILNIDVLAEISHEYWERHRRK